MAESEVQLCAGDGGMCPNPAKKAGLCWGHYKRKMPSRQGGKQPGRGDNRASGLGRTRLPAGAPLEPRARTPLQALARSGRELADADAELTAVSFEKISERFRAALRRYLTKWHAKKSNPAGPKE